MQNNFRGQLLTVKQGYFCYCFIWPLIKEPLKSSVIPISEREKYFYLPYSDFFQLLLNGNKSIKLFTF